MSTHSQPDEAAIAKFLSQTEFAAAAFTPIAGDASTRSYRRARIGDKSAILLLAPPAAEAPECPPDASPEERARLGYNACARLAGPNLTAFTAIARVLRDVGLSAPAIYADDPAKGFALIEDLGDDLYVKSASGDDEAPLYENAVRALVHLHHAAPPPPRQANYRMLSYDATAMRAETHLLMEWYWELKTGHAPSADLIAQYQGLFDAAIARLSAPSAIVLRDYHAENLLWLPHRDGVARVGIIDFQDGLIGHGAYDLVSLLEDARRDVAIDLQQAMIDFYVKDASQSIDNFDTDQFMLDYNILAAQRNAKILGIFARLYLRDKKNRYLDFLPRVEAHFARDLKRAGLEDISKFMTSHMAVFS